MSIDIKEKSELDSLRNFPETDREVLRTSKDLLGEALSGTARTELNAVDLLEVTIQSNESLNSSSFRLVVIFIKINHHHLRHLSWVCASTQLIDVAYTESSCECDEVSVLRVGGTYEILFDVLDADFLQKCE